MSNRHPKASVYRSKAALKVKLSSSREQLLHLDQLLSRRGINFNTTSSLDEAGAALARITNELAELNELIQNTP